MGEVNGYETYLGSNTTSRVMTPHDLRIIGTMHRHQGTRQSGAMRRNC